MKAKRGPRMHRIAPFFKKKIRGSMPPLPPLAWLRTFCARMNILYVSNIAPPPPNMESWIRPWNGTSQISLVTHDAKGEMRE